MNGVRKSLLALALSLLVAASAGGPSHAGNPSPALQWVGTHGIEVAVPAAWKLGRGTCGTPQANTVLWNEDGNALCLTGQPSGLSVVEFNSFLREPRGWYRRHTTPVTIDGVHARRWGADEVRGSHEVQLAFPGRDISITVLSPDPALLRRILASVHTVSTDANGCPTHPDSEFRRGSKQIATQPFVPAEALRMTGCSYQGRWLDHSNRIGAAAARRLANALDAAPYGFSHAPRHTILPSICGSTWRGSVIVTRFAYATRPSVSVAAHLDGCSHLGASNGRWGILLRPAWVNLIVRDARYFGSFPDMSKYR
jgi:hypothetical protein